VENRLQCARHGLAFCCFLFSFFLSIRLSLAGVKYVELGSVEGFSNS
jgi:hypothetical protein